MLNWQDSHHGKHTYHLYTVHCSTMLCTVIYSSGAWWSPESLPWCQMMPYLGFWSKSYRGLVKQFDVDPILYWKKVVFWARFFF